MSEHHHETIDQEKFGAFLQVLRKEKGMTQRELGEKLFVSDKTISKWERGASLPNIGLLLPLAALFDVTVTELLEGARSQKMEETVLSTPAFVEHAVQRQHTMWRIGCGVVGAFTIFGLWLVGREAAPFFKDIATLSFMMLLCAVWLCFFSKEVLPTYYDTNRIGFVTQGIFRINLAGLAINNGNWQQLLTVLRGYTLGTALLAPFVCLAVSRIGGIALWERLQTPFVWCVMGAMILTLYYVGKRYE